MDHTIHTLKDYIALLEEQDLLSAPIPGGLDLSAPVALVSLRVWMV